MTNPKSSKSKKSETKPAEKTDSLPKKTGTKVEKELADALEALTAAQEKAETDRQARDKLEKELSDVREALAAAEAEAEHERQAKTDAKKALSEVEKTMEAEGEKIAPLPAETGEKGAEQRISFILRQTVSEQGKLGRAEVEHAQSGKKKSFPALDIQGVAAFMEACIGTPIVPESTQPFSMVVSDVQAFRIADPSVKISVLDSGEPFVVQTRIKLQGYEAPSVTAHESPYEIEIYAREETSRKSKLLNSYRTKLVKDKLEYTVPIEAPGLPAGVYSMLTVATLKEPVNTVSHFERPILNVI
jgi:multidrug efflux pump subunit AcrA (membrane-fusion protein)